MSKSTYTVFFIAGATRGLGLAFVADIASKYPSAIVYAGARDPLGPGGSALRKIAQEYPSQVEIVKYVSADKDGNEAVAQEIGSKHGKIDIVIANAAICRGLSPIHELDIDEYKEHFSVNVIGPVVLFQAFYHLLKASPNPKFVPITSIGGSLVITTPMPLHATCYSSSKASLNWVARKIHFENEWLVCFPLSPGGVDTDMLNTTIAQDITGSLGETVAHQNGAQTPAVAASTLVDIIMVATRKKEGGLAFVSNISSKYPSAVVYAGARDPPGSGASALKKVALKYPGRVEIVKYIAADEKVNEAAAREISLKHGKIDIIIANAAILSGLAPVHELNIETYREHFSINFMGPLVLFKAFYHLLKASTNPKFIPITSVGGSLVITVPLALQSTCYGSTKAMLNWLARKIHFENEWLVCFPLSPGGVATDMLNTTLAQDFTGSFAEAVARDNGAKSPEVAASALIDIIVPSTRESEGGQYIHVDGSRLPW